MRLVNSQLFLNVFSRHHLFLFLFIFGSLTSFSQDKIVSRPQRKESADTIPKPAAKPVAPPVTGGRGSQVVDDSTRNVYGPKTTKWITENKIFQNKADYQPLDTLLTNYHRWTYVQSFNNFHQDLGNVGTSLNLIFPSAPSTVGASSGFQTYAPFFETEEPRIYDTKSPYTRIFLVWGGDGRAMSRIEFSRNINPRWNFGFNYRPILVDKQIQRQGKGDRQTISQYYDVYSSYRSENKRYFISGTYRRIRHKVNENGGVLLADNTTNIGYYDPNAVPYLLDARTEDFRNAFHLYHQYQLASPLQVYHKLDLSRQYNIFTDTRSQEPNYDDYFKYTTPDADVNTEEVGDSVRFKTIVNEIGLKGNAAFLFYSFYYKMRSYSTFNEYVDETLLSFKNDGIENYLGGQIDFRFDSLAELSGSAEYLLRGNYKLNARLSTPWLDATGISSLTKPAFLPLAYRGSHNAWVNDFSDIFFNQLSGFIKSRLGSFIFSPGLTYTSTTNTIYYKENKVANEQEVIAAQSSGTQQLLVPEVRMSVRFLRHLYFRPQVLYSQVIQNTDQVVRVPEWFINAQLAYENTLFKGNIEVQIGIDAHWRSEYTALGYSPAIQQFYVQDNFVNPAYPLVDVFFNGKLKRGRFFFKYTNILQLITQTGYLPTPGYPGQRNILDFGFDLILFD
jgi:hypothetical protein